MAAIKSGNTKPELVVRSITHKLGYRFRLHRAELPGKPDLVFASRKAVIFVHGCFWHQHSVGTCNARPPKSNSNYWLPKLQRNVERDKRNIKQLKASGWKVLTIWECETGDQSRLERLISKFLG